MQRRRLALLRPLSTNRRRPEPWRPGAASREAEPSAPGVLALRACGPGHQSGSHAARAVWIRRPHRHHDELGCGPLGPQVSTLAWSLAHEVPPRVVRLPALPGEALAASALPIHTTARDPQSRAESGHPRGTSGLPWPLGERSGPLTVGGGRVPGWEPTPPKAAERSCRRSRLVHRAAERPTARGAGPKEVPA